MLLLSTASEATSDSRVGVPVQLGRHRRTVLGIWSRDGRLRSRLSTETLLGMCHTLRTLPSSVGYLLQVCRPDKSQPLAGSG